MREDEAIVTIARFDTAFEASLAEEPSKRSAFLRWLLERHWVVFSTQRGGVLTTELQVFESDRISARPNCGAYTCESWRHRRVRKSPRER